MTNESSKEKKTTSAEETLRQRSFIELAQAVFFFFYLCTACTHSA